VGSVIGLHGLTEERMHETVDLFSQEEFDPNVIVSEIGLEVEMRKYDAPIDWNCYRIIGANIYQWPVVQISLGLYTELKEIKFLGETFLVPNPPKDYLRQRYGSDWGQL
jgi:phosphorylcholine metabolism protein LicD